MGQAWNRFLLELDGARTAVGCGKGQESEGDCYYRGHSSASYELRPGLFRRQSLLDQPKRKRDESFWQVEYDLFYEFRARARELHDRALDGWDVLFWMQHYGAPTRLLDWTETFAVGLYFAVSTARSSDACVWVLNPFRQNVASVDRDALIAPEYLLSVGEYGDALESYAEMLLADGWIGFEMPVAIYPELKNARIHAQRGSFTMHGDAYDTLDAQLASAMSAGKAGAILQKLSLPRAAFDDTRDFLQLAGIGRALLFPDLASLSRELRERYGYL